jgi:hypothetical protein
VLIVRRFDQSVRAVGLQPNHSKGLGNSTKYFVDAIGVSPKRLRRERWNRQLLDEDVCSRSGPARNMPTEILPSPKRFRYCTEHSLLRLLNLFYI